ncbi:VirB4 family type IV secretion/conjugal transfer ATPase [Thiolapillus sp.]|uniref:VirB4 family type IV secretion/conjugal transfer ATPase n=1 Tax=Thiolapillus sp. TaxID=2017437 RepID=UPI003AF7D3ED
MSANANKKLLLSEKENAVSGHICYSSHIDKNTVTTDNGDFIQVIKVQGIAHESSDVDEIVMRLQQLNILYRNIAAPDIALWTHLVRRYQNTFPGGDFQPGFAKDLNDKYRNHLSKNNMMITELYISVVYRQATNKAQSFLSRFEKYNKRELELKQQEGLERIKEVISTMLGGLQPYNPTLLATYKNDHNVLCSEVSEFFAYLINGEYQQIPVTTTKINDVIGVSRPFFGQEILELRMPDKAQYGAILAIKEYPEATEPGLLNSLLSLPFPMVLAQSFTFKSRPAAIELVKRQRDRMINAGDLAETQIEAMGQALDDLTAGRFVMGDHSLSLLLLASKKRSLKNHIAIARDALSDTGSVVCREDLALEAAFWAQLPANFKYRTRPAPITSKNFAGLSSLHNYPAGRLHGNQWGDAVTLLRTASGTPYYFNFHEQLDNARHSKKSNFKTNGREQQKALGNTGIIGPSGSGKTVIQAFLLAQAQKYQPVSVVFDKDRGLELFVRAMKGEYLAHIPGKSTGYNPFLLEPTPRNILFLEAFVKKLTQNDTPFSVQQEEEISAGVRATLDLSPRQRRLSSLLSYLDKSDKEGVGSRLRKWCELTDTGTHGSLHWVFDNVEDRLDFSKNKLFGFDITQFLDDPVIRTPIVMYLFHRMDELINGQRFIGFMDEFWKLLLDEYFEAFANDKLKTIRKLNGLLVLGTQSPKDVLNSPIAHSIIEQCPTMIYLPNPKADPKDYVEGLKLTRREFHIIKEEMPEGSRRFLVKQGQYSVVAELNLRGFNDELAILSGTSDTVELAEQIMKEAGTDPDVWLPIFHQQRKS